VRSNKTRADRPSSLHDATTTEYKIDPTELILDKLTPEELELLRRRNLNDAAALAERKRCNALYEREQVAADIRNRAPKQGLRAADKLVLVLLGFVLACQLLTAAIVFVGQPTAESAPAEIECLQLWGVDPNGCSWAIDCEDNTQTYNCPTGVEPDLETL
jgi:hypothetical protein